MIRYRRTVAFATAGMAAFLGGCRIAKSPEGLCFAPLFKIVVNRPGETHVANGGWSHPWRQGAAGCTVLGTPINAVGCTVGCTVGCAAGCTVGCAAGCTVGCARGNIVETMPLGASGSYVGTIPTTMDTASGMPVHYNGGTPTQGYLAPVQTSPGGIQPSAPGAPAHQEIPNPATPDKGTPLVKTPTEAEPGTKAAKPVPASVQTRIGIELGKDEIAVGETATFGVECRNTGGVPATGLSVRVKCLGAKPLAVVRKDIAADGAEKNVGAKGQIDGDAVVFDAVETLAPGAAAEFQFTFKAREMNDGKGKFEVEVRHSALPAGQAEHKEKTFDIKKK